MNRRSRTLLLAGIAGMVLLVLLFAVLRPADETGPRTATTTATTTTAPPTIGSPELVGVAIHVAAGKPIDGIQRITVAKGDSVQVEVTGAPGEELHLHGYDKTLELGADGAGTLAFEATIQGRFELELERAGVAIADITVR